MSVHAHAPRQRIIQQRHRRLSIRLEEVFWDQLEMCAREESVRLSELVFDVAGRTEESANRTSALRAYCVTWLRQRLAQARLAAAGVNLQAILRACPIPCLVLTQDKKLASDNRLLLDQVLHRLLDGEHGLGDRAIRLSIGRPLPELTRAILDEPEGRAEATMTFALDGRRLSRLGRFCVLNQTLGERSPLLCFLVPPATAARD